MSIKRINFKNHQNKTRISLPVTNKSPDDKCLTTTARYRKTKGIIK